MLQQVTTSPTFAAVVAFYGEPLPHEVRSRGYLQAVCIAKLTALRTMLGEPAIAWHAPAAARAVTAPVPRPKATTAAKRLTAEQFFDAYQIARRNVSSAIGLHWVIQGHARWATLPAGWRSFTGPRGGKVRLPKDCRVPAAEFWPGGVMPAELVIAEPVPVETRDREWGDNRITSSDNPGYQEWRDRQKARAALVVVAPWQQDSLLVDSADEPDAMLDEPELHHPEAHVCKRCNMLVPDSRGIVHCWHRECPEPVEQIDALAEAEFGVDTERELAGC